MMLGKYKIIKKGVLIAQKETSYIYLVYKKQNLSNFSKCYYFITGHKKPIRIKKKELARHIKLKSMDINLKVINKNYELII